MTFSKSIFLISVVVFIVACDRAKSPLGDSGQSATFAIYPDRVHARAELNYATKDSFGHPRTQILHFAVCLQNLVSGQNIVVGTPFGIADGSGVESVRAADVNG